jgi:hypothetical protein
LIGKPAKLSPLVRLPAKKKKIEFLSTRTKSISCGLAILLILPHECKYVTIKSSIFMKSCIFSSIGQQGTCDINKIASAK